MKRRGIRAFFRSFILTLVLAGCSAGLLIGLYLADAGIRSDLGQQARTVFSAREIRGGYEVEMLGLRATLGGPWTLEARKMARRAAGLLPPELRFIAQLLSPPPEQK